MSCNLLSDELVGLVRVMVDVIPVSRVPVMALTLKSPNSPFLTASRSIESTSISLTVELNFRARSIMTLPHLEIKVTNQLRTKMATKMNRSYFHFTNQLVKVHTKQSI